MKYKIGERVKFILEVDKIHRKGEIVDCFKGEDGQLVKYKIDTATELGWFYVSPAEIVREDY